MADATSRTTERYRYRYRMIYTEHRTVLVRDNGHQIDRMVVWPDEHEDRGMWSIWARYGACGLDAAVADALFLQDRL